MAQFCLTENTTLFGTTYSANNEPLTSCTDGYYTLGAYDPASDQITGEVTISSGMTVEEAAQIAWLIVSAMAIALSFRFIRKQIGF